MFPSWTNKHYWLMKGELAYTEDGVLVKSLFFFANNELQFEEEQLQEYFEGNESVGLNLWSNVTGWETRNIAEKLELQQLQKHFEEYGCVERLNLNPIENGRRTGYVVFANPCDAAKALRSICHIVSGCRIVVAPSYSWHQPDAEKMPHRPENVDPNEPPAAIMKLNDHCLENIFSQLSLPDRIHFACYRFRNIYEGMSPFFDKSINFNSNLFEAMTAWDLRDFFQLSGRNIKKIEGTKVSQFTLMSADVAAKNIIDVSKVMKERNYSFEYRDYDHYDDYEDYGDLNASYYEPYL
ncbi:hypothetical protein ACLKA7_008461 [Drosophila subpalustris]